MSLDFERGMNIVLTQGNGPFNQTPALGDVSLVELLSPVHSDPWLLGAGPAFIFLTATSEDTGHDGWQASSDAVVGWLLKEFVLAVFPAATFRDLKDGK